MDKVEGDGEKTQILEIVQRAEGGWGEEEEEKGGGRGQGGG